MSLNPAAGDLLTLVITHTNVATTTALNVLHYRVGSISGSPPIMPQFLSEVGGEFLGLYGSAWSACASDQVTLIGCRVTNVFPLPRSVSAQVLLGTPLAGDLSGEAMPLQDSITILKRTAVGNRWGLGRFFFVGLAETEQANGIISNALRTNLNELAGFLGGALTVNGSGWNAVLNPCLVRGPEDNPVSITNILSCQVSDNIIKTQRRRRPGKGI